MAIGVGLYLTGVGPVQNNSIIRVNVTGQIGLLQCVSGSATANVGRWINPAREDITRRTEGLLVVTVGGESDPGSTSIETRAGYSLSTGNEGVYVCSIPDQDGQQQLIHVGLYPNNFNSEFLHST